MLSFDSQASQAVINDVPSTIAFSRMLAKIPFYMHAFIALRCFIEVLATIELLLSETLCITPPRPRTAVVIISVISLSSIESSALSNCRVEAPFLKLFSQCTARGSVESYLRPVPNLAY